VVRTYVFYARTGGLCHRRHHQQCIAKDHSNAAASREGGFRGELTQMAGRGELIENDLGTAPQATSSPVSKARLMR
jgi:hypothetical protein